MQKFNHLIVLLVAFGALWPQNNTLPLLNGNETQNTTKQASDKMHEMKRVDLDFFDNPQMKFSHKQKIRATKEEVFQFLKVAENWPKWHTSITKVTWTSPEPFQKGTTRTVVINDKYTADEDFLLWKENERFVFRFLRSNIPMASALAEDFHLRDLGNGYCELTMTVASETRGALRLLNWLLKGINERAIEKSLNSLAEYFENQNS